MILFPIPLQEAKGPGISVLFFYLTHSFVPVNPKERLFAAYCLFKQLTFNQLHVDMEIPDFEDEVKLLEGLQHKNVHAFIKLYKDYSEDLLVLAYTLIGDPALSSRAVHKLFTDLWEQGRFTNIHPPLYHFLHLELRKICR